MWIHLLPLGLIDGAGGKEVEAVYRHGLDTYRKPRKGEARAFEPLVRKEEPEPQEQAQVEQPEDRPAPKQDWRIEAYRTNQVAIGVAQAVEQTAMQVALARALQQASEDQLKAIEAASIEQARQEEARIIALAEIERIRALEDEAVMLLILTS